MFIYGPHLIQDSAVPQIHVNGLLRRKIGIIQRKNIFLEETNNILAELDMN